MSLALSHPDAVSHYDRLAPQYDRLHRRWLKHSGGEAQVALEAAVRALVTPTTNLLDAGCGTGAFARALIAEGLASEHVTLLDPSEEMLARCADIQANRVNGRLEALPFQDGAFDMVTCAWALETVQEADLAVRELCRVVRPGGVLCVIFCAQAPSRGLTAWLLRQSIIWRGTGQFLSRDAVVDTILEVGGFEVRAIPNKGPAAAVLARRAGPSCNQDGA
ncbi:MAG: methyltransferase domain-containing protein [Pseudomonadota bacterium]